MNHIIEADQVFRQMPQGGRDLHILNGISFSVDAGEWITLTGPSGSGKSTLLGILAGIDRPTMGSVWLDGIEISAQPESRLARSTAIQMLEKVGLGERLDHFPHQLSGVSSSR